jgi:hypothetical protein
MLRSVSSSQSRPSQAASRHRLAHADLSFSSHVQLLRRAQPRSGAFPPPRRATQRRRWFSDLLDAAGRLSTNRTTARQTPRMIKRRNCP